VLSSLLAPLRSFTTALRAFFLAGETQRPYDIDWRIQLRRRESYRGQDRVTGPCTTLGHRPDGKGTRVAVLMEGKRVTTRMTAQGCIYRASDWERD